MEDYSSKILALHEVSHCLIFKDPVNKFERYINACSIIPKIVQVYNDEWIPDWSNSKEYKYAPYRYLSGGVWLVDSDSWADVHFCPGGFYFRRKEDSESVVKEYRNIYDDFWNG